MKTHIKGTNNRTVCGTKISPSVKVTDIDELATCKRCIGRSYNDPEMFEELKKLKGIVSRAYNQNSSTAILNILNEAMPLLNLKDDKKLDTSGYNYYKEQFDSLPRMTKYGARMVVHLSGEKTNFLTLNDESLSAFKSWCDENKLRLPIDDTCPHCGTTEMLCGYNGSGCSRDPQSDNYERDI